jgi:GNAT superfamily N-acetyltransferase
MTVKLLVETRKGFESDLPLILSSWLKGAYHFCPAFKDMPKSLYYGVHEPCLKAIIATSDVMCVVDHEDPDHILGYVIYKDYGFFTVLHWLYIKQQFRGFGMGAHLLEAIKPKKIVFTTHETPDSQRYFNKRKLKTCYVPHLRHGEWHIDNFVTFLQLRGFNET